MKNFLLAALVIGIVFGCLSGLHEKKWYTDVNGIKFYTSRSIDNPSVCEWKGGVFDSIADGYGEFVCFSEAAKVEHLYARLGNIDTDAEDDSNKDIKYGHKKLLRLHGFAVVTKGDEIFIGNFVRNRPEGFLRYYKNRALLYNGEWVDGKRNGHGTAYIGEQAIEGEWRNDQIISEVHVSFADAYYEGQLLNSIPHGKGTYYSDKLTYSGDWVNGRREGEGTITYENDDSYTGSWKNDVYEGDGVYEFHDGGVYSGEWKNGLQNGYGTYRKASFVYEGYWRDGMMDGQGTIVFVNGDVYSGDFKWNAFNGKGTYSFADGTIYKGDFALGCFNGMGTLYLANNRVIEGEFRDNKPGRFGSLYYIEGEDTVAVEYRDDSLEPPITIDDIEVARKQYIVTGNTDGETSRIVAIENEGGQPILVSRGTANLYKKAFSATETMVEYVSIGAILVSIPFPALAPVLLPFGFGLSVTMIPLTVGEMAVDYFSGEDLNGWKYAIKFFWKILDAVFFWVKTDDAPSDPQFSEYNYSVAGIGTFLFEKGVKKEAEKKVEKAATKAVVEKAEKKMVEKKATEKGVVSAGKSVEGVGVAKTIRPHAVGGYVTPRLPAANKVDYGRFKKAYGSNSRKVAPVQNFKVVKGEVSLNARKALSQEIRGGLAKELSEKKSAVLFKTVKKPSPLPHGTYEDYVREVAEIRNKGAIHLSHRELEFYKNHPAKFGELVHAKTGKTVKNGYMEFLIRTKMGDENAVRTLLTNRNIKHNVSQLIRQTGGGGTHEWLMRSHFDDFLLNPQYGKNGDIIFYMQNKFVQKTDNVMGMNGFIHQGAPRLKELQEMSKMNVSWHSSKGKNFHDGLDNVIKGYKGNNPVELCKRIDSYAKGALSPDSYKDFRQIYNYIFGVR